MAPSIRQLGAEGNTYRIAAGFYSVCDRIVEFSMPKAGSADGNSVIASRRIRQ